MGFDTIEINLVIYMFYKNLENIAEILGENYTNKV